ncbi:MAG: hypothetical protein AAFV88_01255 [Planctomycetota bacterium]
MIRSIIYIVAVSMPACLLAQTLSFVGSEGAKVKDVQYFSWLTDSKNSNRKTRLLGLDGPIEPELGDMGMGGGMGMGMDDMMGMMGGMDSDSRLDSFSPGPDGMMGPGDYGMGMGGMGMGGMDDMGGGMGMGGSFDMRSSDPIALLGGEWSEGTPIGLASRFRSDDDGTVTVPKLVLYRSPDGIRQRFPAIAVSEAGFAFVPTKTKVDVPIRLRDWATIQVKAPKGCDPAEYGVLACWRNGFAYPSLFDSESGLQQSAMAAGVDSEDWRFAPKFEWFQTGEFDAKLRFPPGEVRITVVPKRALAKGVTEDGRSKLTRAELQEWLMAGGPTQSVLLPSDETETKQISFGPTMKQLLIAPPKSSSAMLPQWGSKPEVEYRLYPVFKMRMQEDDVVTHTYTDPMVYPSAPILESAEAISQFLFKTRAERSAFQPFRLSETTDSGLVAFNHLQPGWYALKRRVGEGDWQFDTAITGWGKMKDRYQAETERSSGAIEDAVFRVTETSNGQVTIQVPAKTAKEVKHAGPPRTAGSQPSTQHERLKQIRSLRADVEKSLERMRVHLEKLKAMEQEIAGDPAFDPFGGYVQPSGMTTENPLDSPKGEGNPFEDGSDDPFGGGNADRNPFDESGSDDPIGSGSGSGNPFDGDQSGK